MRIAPLMLLPGLALAGAALAQPAMMPPPGAAADGGPMIAAPPHAASFDPAVATQTAQPGDRFGFRDVADVAAFQPALAPHGRWVDSRWGRAFQPNAPQGWRPYVNGEWGPDRFWRSADPWGWATDHYGRWGFDEAAGWVWVPGTQWAPSWAAWRDDDDVVGWAPIPPQVNYRWDAGFGDDWRWNDWNSWYAPGWVWVPRNQIWAGGFGRRALPWNNGARYWRGSRWNWGWGFGWNDWNRRGGLSIGIGTGWNNWGWNQPWGWNNWGWNRPWGWNNGGWNNFGWNRPGWGGRNRGWDRGWDRGRDRDWNRNRGDNRDWRGNDPRRGAPGSVGDYIGRGLSGTAPPPAGYGDGRRGDGQRGDGQRGDWGRGDLGGGRPDRVNSAPAPSAAYSPPPASYGNSVGASIGRAMAPPPAPEPAPQRSYQPDSDRNPH